MKIFHKHSKYFYILLHITLTFILLSAIFLQKASAATIPYFITPGITAYQIAKPGETFFEKDLIINYSSGKIILSANPDGTGDTFADDAIEIRIRKPGMAGSTFTHNYQTRCASLNSLPPKDITSYFTGESEYEVHVRLYDVCGFWAASDSCIL